MADFSKWRILAKIWKWKNFKFFKHRHTTYRWKGNFMLNNFFAYGKSWKCTQCEKKDKNYDVIICIFLIFFSEHGHVTYRWKGNFMLNNFFAYGKTWKCTQYEKTHKNYEVIIFMILKWLSSESQISWILVLIDFKVISLRGSGASSVSIHARGDVLLVFSICSNSLEAT